MARQNLNDRLVRVDPRLLDAAVAAYWRNRRHQWPNERVIILCTA